MVFALDNVNIISYLLMVKIYMDSNTKKKLKDEGGRGRHLIRSRCVSMASSKVSFLLLAYDYSYPRPPQKDHCLLSCREELHMQFLVLFI